jgi:hypothetical protein
MCRTTTAHFSHTTYAERTELFVILDDLRLMGRQSAILVDPLSPLHHQWVA